jgi:hypothetical protein
MDVECTREEGRTKEGAQERKRKKKRKRKRKRKDGRAQLYRHRYDIVPQRVLRCDPFTAQDMDVEYVTEEDKGGGTGEEEEEGRKGEREGERGEEREGEGREEREREKGERRDKETNHFKRERAHYDRDAPRKEKRGHVLRPRIFVTIGGRSVFFRRFECPN